jgi:hypothetical protein
MWMLLIQFFYSSSLIYRLKLILLLPRRNDLYILKIEFVFKKFIFHTGTVSIQHILQIGNQR